MASETPHSSAGLVPWEEVSDILPEEILTLILSYLPAREIIHHCRRVSKHWKYLADQPSLWTMKYERDYGLPALKVVHPLLDVRRIYVLNPFGRNLSPTLDSHGDKSWRTEGRGVIVESRALDQGSFPGTQPLQVAGCLKCWAFSYMWGVKHQTVSLLEVKTGLSGEFIDEVKPPITVSVWTAARNDCGSKFQLIVRLLKMGQHSRPNITDHEQYQDGVEKLSTPSSFVLKRMEGQWQGGQWYKASHTFTHYPSGIRFIHVILQGKDTQFWAGNFGPKVAAPRVTITMPQ